MFNYMELLSIHGTFMAKILTYVVQFVNIIDGFFTNLVTVSIFA